MAGTGRSLAALFLFLLAACSNHVSKQDLAGTFALKIAGGIDRITLDPSGSYTHSYTSDGGQSDRQEGSWDLETLQAGTTVALNGFRPLLRENVPGNGTYLLLVQKSFTHISLVTNIDLGVGYEKEGR